MSVLHKKRLLHQFALPTNQTQAYGVEWSRDKDLFGDDFALTASVADQAIEFTYRHRAAGEGAPAIVWSFRVGLGAGGRAKVETSRGIEPALSTIFRAAALVEQAKRHIQANPVISFTRAPPEPAYAEEKPPRRKIKAA